MIDIISLTLATLSLCLSLYNWCCERMNLKIHIGNSSIIDNDEFNKLIVIDCTVNNNSKNNITINSVETIVDNIRIKCVPNSVSLGSINLEIDNKTANWERTSADFPIKLTSYDSITASLIFPILKNTELPKTLNICFNTSRGKKVITCVYKEM